MFTVLLKVLFIYLAGSAFVGQYEMIKKILDKTTKKNIARSNIFLASSGISILEFFYWKNQLKKEMSETYTHANESFLFSIFDILLFYYIIFVTILGQYILIKYIFQKISHTIPTKKVLYTITFFMMLLEFFLYWFNWSFKVMR